MRTAVAALAWQLFLLLKILLQKERLRLSQKKIISFSTDGSGSTKTEQ
jgi:hypothetical protein